MKLLQLLVTASKTYTQLVTVQLPDFWSNEGDGSVIDILPQSKYNKHNNSQDRKTNISNWWL
jgi:hypothetical protein